MITRAKKRGVTVIAGVFGNSSMDSSYTVNLESCGVDSQARLGKRLAVVIGDSREVVICEVDDRGEAEGVWTTTPSIILVAKEYIKHDIWGNMLIGALGKSKFQQLCKESPILSYLIKNR